MIFIVEAECFRCGQPLRIDPGIDSGIGTGDLYLKVTRAGLTGAAQCKNIMVCDEYLAEHKGTDR